MEHLREPARMPGSQSSGVQGNQVRATWMMRPSVKRVKRRVDQVALVEKDVACGSGAYGRILHRDGPASFLLTDGQCGLFGSIGRL